MLFDDHARLLEDAHQTSSLLSIRRNRRRSPSTRVAIFHIAGGPDDAPGRPIREYVVRLLAEKRAIEDFAVVQEFLDATAVDWRQDEETLAAEIIRRAHDLKARPVIVLHTVLPFVGSCVSPSFLERFPSLHFPHQFKFLPEKHQLQTFEYIRRASACLFTTRLEIDQAVHIASNSFVLAEPRSFCRFTVVGQPPSIVPTEGSTRPATTGDIAFFGLIRQGKGLEDVLHLTELMASDPMLRNKTLHVVGHVPDRVDSLFWLKRLVTRAYGLGQGSLEAMSLAEIRTLTRDLGPPRSLPIQLHLSLPGSEVSRILSRCTYAYLPLVGGELASSDEVIGLTKHSSSAPILAAHGLVLLAPIGKWTPRELRGGEVVDVKSPEQAANAIRRLDRAKNRRTELVSRSLAWSRKDSWYDVAATIAAVARDVARLPSETTR